MLLRNSAIDALQFICALLLGTKWKKLKRRKSSCKLPRISLTVLPGSSRTFQQSCHSLKSGQSAKNILFHHDFRAKTAGIGASAVAKSAWTMNLNEDTDPPMLRSIQGLSLVHEMSRGRAGPPDNPS